ncbi:hypothetical protein C1H46_012404 [Malus baccata]|uniref:Uncharacterized protein n=1 Tax=Malus baccata TaxID=106549 RepID=A0A540MUC6_MALBA|nr:hypothetical protein C1H46_012404 [Malus baccata]
MGLACTENRCDTPSIISDLEAQLETINKSIRSKNEEQHKATRMINGINQALDQTHQKTERFKCDAYEELQVRSRLKQCFLMRRQTLRTLQLGLEAVRIEKETLVASEKRST